VTADTSSPGPPFFSPDLKTTMMMEVTTTNFGFHEVDASTPFRTHDQVFGTVGKKVIFIN
jgi:hypothetical protein